MDEEGHDYDIEMWRRGAVRAVAALIHRHRLREDGASFGTAAAAAKSQLMRAEMCPKVQRPMPHARPAQHHLARIPLPQPQRRRRRLVAAAAFRT